MLLNCDLLELLRLQILLQNRPLRLQRQQFQRQAEKLGRALVGVDAADVG